MEMLKHGIVALLENHYGYNAHKCAGSDYDAPPHGAASKLVLPSWGALMRRPAPAATKA